MLFSQSTILFTLLAALSASALPHQTRRDNTATTSTCDLQNAVKYMYLDKATVPAPLPQPSSGLRLYTVALGQGTQNYTCDLSNSTAVPVSIGATASLFNASCFAADHPHFFRHMPRYVWDQKVPGPGTAGSEAVSANAPSPDKSFTWELIGHHYFVDNFTTPYFNLDTETHAYGAGPMNKTAAADAPPKAEKGQYGAVQWLMLDALDGADEQFQMVYRLHTASGEPPATCDGQQAHFEIPYAAQYWFFVSG